MSVVLVTGAATGIGSTIPVTTPPFLGPYVVSKAAMDALAVTTGLDHLVERNERATAAPLAPNCSPRRAADRPGTRRSGPA